MNESDFGEWLFNGKNPDFKLYADIEDRIFSLTDSNFEEILSFVLSLPDKHKTYAIECSLYFSKIEIFNENIYSKLLNEINNHFPVEDNDNNDTEYPDEDLLWIYEKPKSDEKENQIKQAIFHDGEEKLIYLTADSKQMEQTISGHSLIEFSCLCGAVNCFKYLMINDQDLSHCSKAAVYGGNEEICQILADKGCNFDLCLLTAFKAHQHNVAHWLMMNYSTEIQIDLNNIVKSFNTLAFLFLSKDGIDKRYLESSRKIPFISLRVKPVLPVSALITSAARVSNFPVIEMILEQGGDVDALGVSMLTALQIASLRGNTDLVKFLIEKKANVNFYNENVTMTAMMFAKNLKILKLLYEAGADINAENRLKKTVLDIAIQKEHNLEPEKQEMTNFLKSLGAKQNKE